MISLLDCCS